MKKLLLSLFIGFISLISFGNCETVSNKLNSVMLYTGTFNLSYNYTNVFDNGGVAGTYCVKFTSNDPTQLTFGFANGPTTNPSNIYTLYYDQYNNWICLYGNKSYFNAKLGANKTISINYEVFKLTDLLNVDITCPTCNVCNECEIHIGFNDISENDNYVVMSDIYIPDGVAKNYSFYYNSDYNTIDINNYYKNGEILVNTGVSLGGGTCENDLLQCQSDYSSCSSSLGTCGTNLNSCQNTLGNCMNGQVGTGINWSSLFINNIQHLGKPIINITIPEEFNWDYTNSGSVFDLNIVGYNVDYDKINGIINLQNTKPTEEDFNKIVSEVVPLLVPGLFIIAFIYFVFRFIKKLF